MQPNTAAQFFLCGAVYVSFYYNNTFGADAIHLISPTSVDPLQTIATSSNKTATKENMTGMNENARQKTLKPIKEMKLFAGNASAQKKSCRALSTMAFESLGLFTQMNPSEIQNTIFENHGDLQAIKAMKRFPHDVQLQIECAAMLASLAQWNPQEFVAMGKHGAIEVIASAIKRFPNDTQMLNQIGVLGAFTDYNASVAGENLKKIEKTGVMSTILESLDKHFRDGPIVISALGFFSNACLSSKLRNEMIKHGFPVKFVSLMKAYANTTRQELAVRGEVIGVLERCFTDSCESCGRMVDAGLIEAVVGTMNDAIHGVHVDPMGNPRMQKNSMSLIRKLVKHNTTLKHAIVKAGAVDQIMTAINQTLAKPRQGCNAVAALVGNDLPLPCESIFNATTEWIKFLNRTRQKDSNVTNEYIKFLSLTRHLKNESKTGN